MLNNFSEISFNKLLWEMMSQYKEWDLSGCDLMQANKEVDNAFSELVWPDLGAMAFPFLKFLGIYPQNFGGDGTSCKTFAQCIGWFDQSYFKKYDHGKEENFKRYNRISPPLYDFKSISTKTSIITGEYDFVCNTDAANKFANVLNKENGSEICKVYELEGYKHVSFAAPKNPKKVFDIVDKITGYF